MEVSWRSGEVLGSEDWLRLVQRPDIPTIALSLAVRSFIPIFDWGIEEEVRKEEGREGGRWDGSWVSEVEWEMGWVLG